MAAILLRAFALLILAAAPAAGEGPAVPAGLEAGTSGTVAAVTDGDTVELADGRRVRLVGLQAPKLPLGRPGFPTWPLAQEAKAALESLALGHRVGLHYGGARSDRHGRELAHLVRVDGLWLQGEMLARGWARVYSFDDNRAVVRQMYALEARARAAKRGIWAHPFYRVVAAGDAGRFVGSFQLVEGRVAATAVIRGRGYINFGADWRTDFTIAVPKRARKAFSAAFGAGLERLRGRNVRVRGWLRRYNGPLIAVTHPEQIEVLIP